MSEIFCEKDDEAIHGPPSGKQSLCTFSVAREGNLCVPLRNCIALQGTERVAGQI